MKSIVNKKEEKTGVILLFDKEGCGTVINNGENKISRIGQFRNDLSMDTYTPFPGTVTLSNE